VNAVLQLLNVAVGLGLSAEGTLAAVLNRLLYAKRKKKAEKYHL